MLWLLLAGVPLVALSAVLAARWSSDRTRHALDERIRLLLDVAASSDLAAGAETDRLVARIAATLRIEAAALLVRDGDHLVVAGAHGYWPHLRSARFRRGEGLVGRAWAGGRSHLESDVSRRSEYLAGGPGLRSGLYVLGRCEGEVMTVLCLESRHRNFFTRTHVAEMEPVADLLAVSVHGRVRLESVTADEQALLRTVGEQMREPLTAVSAALGALDGPPLLGVDPVAQAAAGARRLARLLDGLHLAATLPTGPVDVLPRELAPLVHAAVAPTGAGTRLEPVRALVDADLFLTALRELLDNAARHAPGAPVTVELTGVDGWARVAVRDAGPGIPTDDLLELLREAQGPATTPRTRLGLYLARGLAERMGGRLDVWSRDGVGTTVTLSLPLAG